MIDEADEGKLRVGDEVSLWDHNPSSLLNLSDQLETISYEVFCHIGQRIPRIYRQ